MEIVKKISVTGINGIRGGFKNVEVARTVARVVGIVRAAEVLETQYGEATRFRGEFRAYNEERDEFASTALFLPEPAQSLLLEASERSEGGVQFAFDVGVKPDAASPLGYSYTVRPLIDAAPSDPLQALLQQVKSAPAIEVSETKAEKPSKKSDK